MSHTLYPIVVCGHSTWTPALKSWRRPLVVGLSINKAHISRPIIDNSAALITTVRRLFCQGFDHPHDLAVSPDGESVFVGETGPDVVWKFIKEQE